MRQLKLKSKENFEIAKYSEKKNYYDVAISRYYYYIYQNLIIYINETFDDFEINVNRSSHNFTIEYLTQKFLTTGFETNELRTFANIRKLKVARTKADYKNIKIRSKAQFNSNFKDIFDPVNELLKRKQIIRVQIGNLYTAISKTSNDLTKFY